MVLFAIVPAGLQECEEEANRGARLLRAPQMTAAWLTKENVGLAALVLLVVAGLVFSIGGLIGLTTGRAAPGNPPAQFPAAQASPSRFPTISTGTTAEGDVQIDLSPKGVNSGQLFVAVSANTHSVELSAYNLAELAVLEYGGKSVRPSSAPAFSGHHNSGSLVFNVDEDLQAFTITIRGIPAVSERVFAWE